MEKRELNEAVDFLRELIRIPSSDEADLMAKSISKEMRRMGFDHVTTDNLCNVIGHMKGSTRNTKLLYVSHVDTGPLGDMVEGYSGRVMDGAKFGKKGKVIYGRGASGVKGALAAMILAGGFLKRARVKLMGELVVAATAKTEQANHDGLRYMVDRDGLTADMAINGECTNNKVILGSRGRLELEVVARGAPSHAGEPNRGVNAISSMAKLLNELSKLSLPTHKFLGKATMTPVKIQFERQPYSIPDVCTAVIDRRTLPNETPDGVKSKLLSIVRRLKKKDPRFEARVRIRKVMYGQELSPTEPIVISLRKSIESAGRRPVTDYVRYSTDGSYLTTVAKIPTVTFGPGRLEDVLSSAEHIEMESFFDAIRIYTINALQLLSYRGKRP